MATIDTRINENKKIEFFVYDIGNDLDALMDVIDKLRENYPLDEEKIFITEDLEFFRQTIDREINFSGCVFEKIIIFREITFKEQVDFRNTIFQDNAFFSKVVFQKHTSFPKVVFQRYVNFNQIEFLKSTDFSNVKFQDTAYFKEINFQEDNLFYEANFEGEVWFSKVKSKKNIIFWNTKFQDKAKFQTCKFYNSTFENAIFNRLVDFSSSTFQSPQNFYSTNFMDTANFANTTFEQEAKFTDCKVDSKTLISFQCATFKKGLDISTSNFNLCKLNFLGIRIENINEALSSAFYEDKRDNTKPFLSIHQRLRETFRFIKNSLYAENNQIEGLEFHKKEMEVYEKELKLKLRNGRTEKKEGKTNPLWVDIVFAIFCILLLVAYLYWCDIFYWGLIVSMLIYFVITITKSNITRESIVKPLSKNPVVYGTVWLLAIAYILCFFYALYKTPKEFNNIAWIVFISGIFASLLLFSNLTKDNIILFLNKHSNDFGTNWVNGIAFTFLCGIITFILMAIFSNLDFSFSYEGVNNFISSIIKIVNLVDTKPFEIKDNAHLETKNSVSLFSKMNIPTYITLFIGRIFIGYGYYQTIQAFRKYGKS